jgi:hypothetical protein
VTSHFDLSSRRGRVSGFHSLELSLAAVVGSLGLDEVGLAVTELVSENLKSDLCKREGEGERGSISKGSKSEGYMEGQRAYQ